MRSHKSGCCLMILLAATTCLAQISTTADRGRINIGLTWCNSDLVVFNPFAGTAERTGVRLDPGTCFRGLTYDSEHNRLYALAQVSYAFYSINPDLGVVKRLGKLDLSGAGDFGSLGVDIGGLAYWPNHGLYTTVTAFDDTTVISEIVQINPRTRQVIPISKLPHGYAGSLVWDSASRSFLGYTTPCSGQCKTSMFRFNPATGKVSILFKLPYHVVAGLAPSTKHTGKYISWINSTTAFYAEIDPHTGSIVPLANSDAVGVWSDAMMTIARKRFHLGH
jgi:hypothetical protein